MNQPNYSSTTPQGEKLLATALPFSDAVDLLNRIITAWQECFQLRQLAIVWKDVCGWEVAIAQFGSELIRFRCETFQADEQIAVADFSSDPRFDDFSWRCLEFESEFVGYVGCDNCQPIEIPHGWISMTARLLSVMIRWNRNLNDSKLAALGEFAAGAGHEINNPLAAIRGRAEQLLADETHPGRRQLLETIGAQTLRIRDMIGDTMLFARPPEPNCSSFNLTELIAEVMLKLVDDFEEGNISLWGNREKDVVVFADRNQIAVVISELIRNAINAVSENGRITIDCLSEKSRGICQLKISDDGTGFTKIERQHCFDPFFSGRQAGRGLGFGLSKAWRIVTNHGGQLTLSDSMPTEFVVTLPCPVG